MRRFRGITLSAVTAIFLASAVWAQPMSGSYDVGGGANDFPSIVAATTALTGNGMSGPVTFNVYPGTYNGQSLIQNITGLGQQNPLVYQAATGDRPVVTNPTTGTHTGNGFHIRGSSYVTIRGFEFQNCGYCGVQTYYGNSSSDSSSYITIENNYFNQTSNYMMHTYRTHHAVIANNEFNAAGSYGFRLRYTTDSKIYNNVAYGASSYGAYCYNIARNELYFNSIYCTGTRTFYMSGSSSTNCTIMNNIFYSGNIGTGYAAYYYTGSNPISDYNCFYAPNCNVGYYGSACATLAQFQAATGQDAHSIDVDPLLISVTPPYDFHISDLSPCISAGTGIPGINTDFEGDIRDPATPCMGADETAMVFNLELALEPVNPPVQIPANWGSFQYTASVTNNENEPVNCDIWIMVTLPSGALYGPVVGPVNMTFPANISAQRVRGQAIPAGAPAGRYVYDAYLGLYDTYIWHEDHFSFTKLTDSDGGLVVTDWYTWGDALDGSGYEEMLTPIQSGLSSAYPNPFNPTTKLTFQLSEAGKVVVAVYDVQGREVARLFDGWRETGVHKLTFDASTLASGVYFAHFESAETQNVKKLILVK